MHVINRDSLYYVFYEYNTIVGTFHPIMGIDFLTCAFIYSFICDVKVPTYS